MKRRSFITSSSLWAGTAWLAAGAVRPGIKFGACDWTLRLTADPASLELAKRIGLDGVQVDFGHQPGPDGMLPLFDRRLQEEFLAGAARTGVAIPSLAMGVLNKVALKNDPAAEKWMLAGVEVAKRMKAAVVLLAFFGNGDLRGDEPGIESVIVRLRKLAPLAEAAGVVYGIESWLKVPVLERILDRVNSTAVKVYYDVGNMHKEGEDIFSAIGRLGRERICEFHAKDYDDLYGRGSIDFVRVREAIAGAGFTSGWMHIEGVKIPNGVEQDIRHDLLHLRKVFAGAP